MLNQVAKRPGSLHVVDLARRTGVTPATVRYYARIGLLSPEREPENGYRCFSSEDVHRVKFIRQAQALGLTIGDLKAIFASVEKGEVPCGQVKSMVEHRLVRVRKQIYELEGIESRATEALAAWRKSKDLKTKGGEFCPLIERLAVPNGSASERGATLQLVVGG